MQQPLLTYLEKLVSEAHQNLPDTLRSQMIKDLYGRLLNHLMLSYMQALPDEQATDFDNMMQQEVSQDKIQTFLQERIPNFQEVTAQSLLEFRDIYLAAGK